MASVPSDREHVTAVRETSARRAAGQSALQHALPCVLHGDHAVAVRVARVVRPVGACIAGAEDGGDVLAVYVAVAVDIARERLKHSGGAPYEDVLRVVRIGNHEVERAGVERNHGAVRVDGRIPAGPVCLRSTVDRVLAADQFQAAGVPVEEEHVRLTGIGIDPFAGNEVGREGGEGHVAAVGAHHRVDTNGVCLIAPVAVVLPADELEAPRLPVEEEDIARRAVRSCHLPPFENFPSEPSVRSPPAMPAAPRPRASTAARPARLRDP